jgi:hypothetical protein
MADKWNGLLDYLEWRGDLSFEQAPFNDVDALLLTQIAYVPFDGLVPGLDRRDRISLAKLSEKYFTADKGEHLTSLGVLIPSGILDILHRIPQTRRFKNVRAGFYLNDVDETEEKQFCAITFFVGEEIMFVAYRGTDDTIVGWKEDFNMGFMQTVPAQLEADRYFGSVMENVQDQGFDGRIYLGGHSKGGNLAVYAAMTAKEETKELLEKVYNFDGPGFGETVVKSSPYQQIRDKIHTFVPQSSIVGMLLSHEEEYTVVKSWESGILQHNALSWQVLGADFIVVSTISETSTLIDRSLKKWIEEMSEEQMETFVTAMFDILGSSQALTLTQLATGKTRSISVMIRTYRDGDEQTKKVLKETLKSLVNISRNTFVEFLTNTVKNNKI